jgi:hypothetical protein
MGMSHLPVFVLLFQKKWLLLPNVHAVISWGMTPCSLVGRYESDGET